jgi:hypothetical protein
MAHPARQTSPKRRERHPIGQRAAKACWAVQCCVCGAIGPIARKRETTAAPARRSGFELRKLGTITGWLCEHCCEVRDSMSPPATRGECELGARPCTRVLCRYHLVYDISRKAKKDFVVPLTCALDFARDNPEGATLKEIGKLLGCTREGIRYLELSAKAKIKATVGIRFSFLDEEDKEFE